MEEAIHQEINTVQIKLKLKQEYETRRKDNEKEQSKIQVKLPKLKIKNFQGTHSIGRGFGVSKLVNTITSKIC